MNEAARTLRAPLFALVMPAYNAVATIDEALESVLAQTFADWELVVVDDGSTDTTRQRAEAFAARDARIRVLSQANAGPGPARNRAVAATTAPWIVNFDADDVLLSHCLATYAEVIAAHPSRDIFSCDLEVFSADGELGRYYRGFTPLQPKPEFTLDDMIDECMIANPASVISRPLHERVGGTRAGICAEDYDLWLRALAQGGRHLLVPQALVRYRRSPTQQTAAADPCAEGTAAALRSLAASGLLSRRLARRARAAARHRVAPLRRAELERRLAARRYAGVRRLLWDSRNTFPVRWKYGIALAAAVISPRLLAALLAARRSSLQSNAGL